MYTQKDLKIKELIEEEAQEKFIENRNELRRTTEEQINKVEQVVEHTIFEDVMLLNLK